LAGHRVPDADLSCDVGATRVYEPLNAMRPVLLVLSNTPGLTEVVSGWASRIGVVAAHSGAQTWDVPGVGAVAVPAAVLIRPDGYVAWASPDDGELAGLRGSLTTWAGQASVPEVIERECFMNLV
jgi:hypothetical protein